MTRARITALLAAAELSLSRWPRSFRVGFRRWLESRPDLCEPGPGAAEIAVQTYWIELQRQGRRPDEVAGPPRDPELVSRVRAVGAARASASIPFRHDVHERAAFAAAAGSPQRRARALADVADQIARGGAIPDAAIAAIDDDVLIDAALSMGLAGAITAVIDAAGERVDPGLRRHIALRLAAAEVGGVHVAALQLSVGDRDAAIDALARGLDRLPEGPAGDAAIELAATWIDDDPELAAATATRLAPARAAALAGRARQITGDHRLARALSERAGQVS